MALAQDKQKEYSDTKGRGNLNVFRKGDLVLLDTKNLPLKVASSVKSNKLKHRFVGKRSACHLARHGATIDLPKSMATHPTFYVGRLKRYHDPLGLPSRTEEDQGEKSPPRNEAESSSQPKLPMSESYPRESYKGYDGTEWEELGYTHEPSGTSTPAAHKRAYDHAPHGLERLNLDGGSSRSPAVNAPMELMSLTTKSVQILTKDLKGPRLASLRGSLTTRSKPKGYLDRVNTISKLTDLVA
ncbi:LOW QUALITY PROTEIN: Pol protein [Phytophthora palmivora]|uniref:Pol protein n=1 Tax=Phytophthora palmivora TaxID=4796 RepID=A0A2P4Y3N2_9STRA|nr:LOW QUALITY PROTEIN: Pol protein [Phytophthora palmivora]